MDEPTLTTRTPRGEEIRATVEARLSEARKATATPETVRVEWRGQPAHLDVITMPVDDLYYNPETHRVRAQRAHNPARDTTLATHPWSKESQEYLHDLLTAKPDAPDTPDPAFAKLKEDLAQFGQNDPGIITHEGILVNGNTRRAALKELGKTDIRVAVLPADATFTDIAAVELELQLREDHRREYSYINRLIAVHEQVSSGRHRDDIKRAFRTTAASIDRDLWIYNFITDAVARSRTKLADGTTASLRLMDFEGHQESLRELYRACKDASAEEAQIMRESRLLALVMDTAKTKLRYIREDFHHKYLAPKLDERFSPAAAMDDGAEAEEVEDDTGLPGLDLDPDLELDVEPDEVVEARAATDAVLKAKVRQTFSASLTVEESSATRDLLNTVREALDRGVATSEADIRRSQRKMAAAETLEDAARLVRETTQQLAQARSQDLLQHGALDGSLLQLAAALKQLSRHASRGVDSPGPGLTWLQDAVADL
jgi:hypothetical protein